MEFIINGDTYHLDRDTVTARLRGRSPEPVQTHWVEVAGTRFPVLQALEAVIGLNRRNFNSLSARAQFARLGFATSDKHGGTARSVSTRTASPVSIRTFDPADKPELAFGKVLSHLRRTPLTTGTDELERALLGADADTAASAVAAAGYTADLLRAALTVRREVGRISDVIHTAVISLLLPLILEDGEVVEVRPSLGPGNDGGRPFDLATSLRVAEIKVSVWSGGDAGRQKMLAADLFHLAYDHGGRRPELWTVGPRPIEFLRTSRTTMQDLLSRSSQKLRARPEAAAIASLPVRDFLVEHASHVGLRDISELLPAVAELATPPQ